jgi:hypothetical protein
MPAAPVGGIEFGHDAADLDPLSTTTNNTNMDDSDSSTLAQSPSLEPEDDVNIVISSVNTF